jgi:hypothetical protein
MGTLLTLLALIGLLGSLGHIGYVAMLNNAAKKKGASGSEIARYSRSRFPVAGGTAGVAVLGFLLTLGGTTAGIIGVVLALGAGLVGYLGLRQERSKYPTS